MTYNVGPCNHELLILIEKQLTTRAALVVIERPAKKNDPQMTTNRIIAPAPL